MIKTCGLCGRCEPSVKFQKGRRQCEFCRQQYQKDYRKTSAGRTSLKKAGAKWYAKIKNTASYISTRKKWRDANPEKIRAARLARYARNVEVVRAKNRAKLRILRASNPEYFRKALHDGQERHRVFMQALKSQPCLDCGGLFPPIAMDFDHVRGAKLRSVANMTWSFSQASILVEIRKCDLVCACCHRIRTQKRRRVSVLSLRRQWLNSLKKGPCRDCGRTFPPEATDFDHVRGHKVAGIARMWNQSPERVRRELSKCELVCACCHRVRTSDRRNLEHVRPTG